MKELVQADFDKAISNNELNEVMSLCPLLQTLGLETLVMGPGSIDQAHQPDEYLELSQLQPTVDILKGLIKRFCL